MNDYVQVNKKNLFYRMVYPQVQKQDTPLLIFLHEGLGSTVQWRDFPDLLCGRTGCTALIYDRYGYGESEIIKEERTDSYMPEEARIYLIGLIEALHISSDIVLVGHSDGGTIALLFASMFPNKIKGVITEADHVINEKITIDGVKNVVKEYTKENSGLKKLLMRFHGEKTDNMFSAWSNYWLNESRCAWHIKEELQQITVPVLAIQGHDDVYGSVDQLITKLNFIKGPVDIAYIPSCGHVPHFEAREVVLNKMTAFINQISLKKQF